jgi:uncharacterized protein (TIGR02594 family)
MTNKLYTVRPGDTLSAIARHVGTQLSDLLLLNPQISNPNLIHVGQVIVLSGDVDRSKLILDLALEAYTNSDPKWLKVAKRELANGVRESDPSNPRVVEYLATCSDLTSAEVKDDGTAWCSSFVNWAFYVCEIVGTNSAWALNWKDWGIESGSDVRGALAVWARYTETAGERTKVGGHVGFILEDQGDRLLVLGGNQGDAVSERSYPKAGYLADTVSGRARVKNYYQIVSCRWPKGV